VVADPRRVPFPAQPPIVHIEEVRVAGERRPTTGEIALPPGADLEIRYSSPSLRAPERLRFQYRLEGFDSHWQEAGAARAVRYTNLPPRRFRFQVVAVNDEGVWSPKGATLDLVQRPRFHQAGWFAVLVVASLAAALSLVERLRLRQLAGRQRQLERMVDERTRSLVEAQENTRQSLLRLQASEGELRRLNENLEQLVLERTVELREARDVAIFTLAKLAELRDGTTGRHLERIAAYSQILAAALHARGAEGVGPEFVEQIYRSSPLHDIGKVAIPDAILRKPTGLSAEEERLMRLHTTIGGDVLSTVIERHGGRSLLHMAMEIAYSHHERWDGNGYPRGLAGGEIPLPARIVAVVDAYDAIISPRPYKPPLTHQEAVRRIAEERGSHFDPVLVDAFLAVAPDIERATSTLRG
jgi:response regulator RpfG family c-di-GMP phosphodiesterase